MSRKLKFKIISCSSQEQEYPVSSLLFNGAEGWQSRRFCSYPQQITIEFYGIVNIKKLQLVSDHRKISSQVDILYYVPIAHQQQRFYKYGYLQFNRADSSNLREVKTIMVDINCLYLRLLFHKPYPSKENFFSQIGLAALSIFGLEQPEHNLEPQDNSLLNQNEEGINEEDEKYIWEKVTAITAQKDKAIAEEDYENASYYKSIISLIEQTRTKLREKRVTILRALEDEDYETAKATKSQIDRQKQQINAILLQKSQNPSRMRMHEELEENQFADLNKSHQAPQNEFMDSQREANAQNQREGNAQNQREGNAQNQREGNSRNSYKHPQKIARSQAEDSYDERVIPTINKNGRANTELNEQDEQKPRALPPVQEVEGKYIKDASVMQQYFDEEIVKKFFSGHWQHNLDSLVKIQSVIGKQPKQIGLVKCLITIVKYSSKQSNFQVGIQALNVFKQLLKLNAESQAISKPGDSQNDLDEIGKEIVKKLADNNAKIKQAAQQCFGLMVTSLLFGVQGSSLLLSKTKSKLNSKQITTRLHLLTNLIQDHGTGTPNAVPLACLEFAIEHCSNAGEQVRKAAIQMLRVAYRRDPGKTELRILALKEAIQEQIKEGDTPVAKNKKK